MPIWLAVFNWKAWWTRGGGSILPSKSSSAKLCLFFVRCVRRRRYPLCPNRLFQIAGKTLKIVCPRMDIALRHQPWEIQIWMNWHSRI